MFKRIFFLLFASEFSQCNFFSRTGDKAHFLLIRCSLFSIRSGLRQQLLLFLRSGIVCWLPSSLLRRYLLFVLGWRKRKVRVCEEMMISQNGSILAHDDAETCLCSTTNYCSYAPMIPFFVFLSLFPA